MADLWDEIADGAAEESSLWADCLSATPDRTAVFSPLAKSEHALGLETIYEGYLVHYGRPRLFAPRDADTSLLLGDYLYAHGLVRVAAQGDVDAVAALAELISLCARLRGDGTAGDGAAWAGTAAALGTLGDGLDTARAALEAEGDERPLLELARAAAGERVDPALAAHRLRLR